MFTILNWPTAGSDGWTLTLQFEISYCHGGAHGESPSFGTSYRAEWFIHTDVSLGIIFLFPNFFSEKGNDCIFKVDSWTSLKFVADTPAKKFYVYTNPLGGIHLKTGALVTKFFAAF